MKGKEKQEKDEVDIELDNLLAEIEEIPQLENISKNIQSSEQQNLNNEKFSNEQEQINEIINDNNEKLEKQEDEEDKNNEEIENQQKFNEKIIENSERPEKKENEEDNNNDEIESKQEIDEKQKENENSEQLKKILQNPQKAQFSIVVSDLPECATSSMVLEFCKNGGAIATHPETGEELILFNKKAHKATVTYCYQEGVNQAIELLNNATFLATGARVKVERAPREPFDFNKWKSAMKLSRKFHSLILPTDDFDPAKEKIRCILIFKNVFTPDELVNQPELYGQIIKDFTHLFEVLIKDINDEFKISGKCTLVKPMENNPDGIVIVRFNNEALAARICGKLDEFEYRNRNIVVDPWDGVEIPVGRETEEQLKKRIENFHAFQEGK